MDFNITTKYDIGDKVYIAERCDKYVPSEELIVTTIEIEISANKTKVIYYLNKGDEFHSYYFEDLLFATCEECTKWCEEHNENS